MRAKASKHAALILAAVSLSLDNGRVSAEVREAEGGRLVIVDGSTVSALELPEQNVRWSVDTGFSPSSVIIVPDGNDSVVLVSTGAQTLALDGTTGAWLWTHAGVLMAANAIDVYRQAYTDPVRYPCGPPNLGGGPAPDLLILGATGSPRTTYLVDSRSGEEIWSRTEDSDTRGFQFLATPTCTYDVIFSSEGDEMLRVDGATGTTVLWSQPHTKRWGVPTPDVNGDDQPDLFAEPAYYDSIVRMLDGATGEDIWSTDYDSFDVLGGAVIVDALGIGAIATAQNSSAGGIRRYDATNGTVEWDCSSAYNNNTLIGLLQRTDGWTVLSGWRHHSKAIAVDAVTGDTLWDSVPSDPHGLGVPDLTGDGSDDFLSLETGWLRLYDGVTGAEQAWFAPIEATDAAYDDTLICTVPLVVVGDASGNVIAKTTSDTTLASVNMNDLPIARIDAIDLDGNGTLEVLATHDRVANGFTTAFDMPALAERCTTDYPTSFEGSGHELFGKKIWPGDFDDDGTVELVIPYYPEHSETTYQVFSAEDCSRECVLEGDRDDTVSFAYRDPVDSTWRLATENNPTPFTHTLYIDSLDGCPMDGWCVNAGVNTWKLGGVPESMIDGEPRIWGGWYGRTLYVVDRNCTTLWSKSFGGSYEAEGVYAGDLRCDGVEVVLVGGTYGTNHVRLDAARLDDGQTLWTFDDTNAHWSLHVMGIEDVDCDCVKEVFFVTGGNESHPRKYQCVSGANGNRLWERPYTYGTWMVDHARFLDVNGDGEEELLVIVNDTIEALNPLDGSLVDTLTFGAQVNGFEIVRVDDSDCDGVLDDFDNCPDVPNPGQIDTDGDEVGDACDPCTDVDGDGWGQDVGNGIDCPNGPTPDCDDEGSNATDPDVDNICDPEDNCDLYNPAQMDCQPNAIGDVCDLAYCGGEAWCGDCNGNEVPDGCDIGGETSGDCNTNDVPDECDIAGGTSSDDNENGIPDKCEANTPLPPAAPHDARKNRYVSFDPNNSAPMAFKVEMVASAYFPESLGILGWVGEPVEAPEDPGVWVSRVVDTPYYSDSWPAVVHLRDCEIVPVATYLLRATPDEIVFSDPLEIATIAQPAPKYWADCVGALEEGAWTAPNAVVNMDDVMAAVQKFKKLATAPHLTWVDIDGEEPNLTLNFGDIQMIVQGFKAEPYPFSDPAECP